MRVSEIVHLTVGNLRGDAIEWIGKKARPRKVSVGPVLAQLLADYLGRYEAAIGRPLAASDPVVCREKPGHGRGQVSWGNPFAQACSIHRLVVLRASLANLGHVSPHDLRRSAAGILHRATAADGGHLFDLLDIQRVLGHSDPVTTMRSYLEPIDRGVLDRAASVLD
jgi:integrase